MANFNARRHFAIRTALAKKAANDNQVVIDGVRIEITDANRDFVEAVRADDAERAYEAAAFDRTVRLRVAG